MPSSRKTDADREQRLQAALVALRDAIGEAGCPWIGAQRPARVPRGELCLAMDLEPVIEPIAIDKLVPALARYGIVLGSAAPLGPVDAPVVRATHTATGVQYQLRLLAKLSGGTRRELARSLGARWESELRRVIRERERAIPK